KPFRQKGTGRARQGSTRAPHYAGGGVALGPKPRSYRQRTPRKMVQLALRGALSDRAGSGQVAVVDAWDWEVPSTKDALAALTTLELTGRVLIVLSREDERAYKSFRNLAGVDLVLVPELNAYDVLCSDWVVFTRTTLPGNSTWGEAPAAASTTAGASTAGASPAGASTAGASTAGAPSTGRATARPPKAGEETGTSEAEPEDGGATEVVEPAATEVVEPAAAVETVGAVAPAEAREAAADTTAAETGTTETGTTGAGTTEAGTTKAGTTEAGTTEVGTTEAGTAEAGTADVVDEAPAVPEAGGAGTEDKADE
ncbi:MAG TPA: 50S ribosomal protein L4, partial [Acidimicrobiales bacterium]|nr:50S ribosomal protein L4 [Acidimicrobiales bacterium]